VVGAQFDDAATVQGLLTFFSRALASGAVDAGEVQARVGLTADDLEVPSLARVLERRRAASAAAG
jgi:hypothetical protein